MRERLLMAALAVTLILPSTAGAEESSPIPQAGDPWFVAARRQLELAGRFAPIEGPARNVILFIGDGMGPSTITAARIFEGHQRGQPVEENLLDFERFPHLALAKTYNTDRQVSDSAGTATALASGVKTGVGVIGLDQTARLSRCGTGRPVVTVLELAEAAGLSTGIVTTTRITHATPAAFFAHLPDRHWESDRRMLDDADDADLDPGDCHDIARQLVELPYGDGIDVALGGGRTAFLHHTTPDPGVLEKAGQWLSTRQRLDRDLVEAWRERHGDAAAFVWNRGQLLDLEPSTVGHVLGLFSPSHMAYEADRNADAEPSLSEMTRVAIRILSRNPEGFFLMVEGGRIDHAHHETNAYRALVDTVELDRAVRTAAEATSDRDTLIIVTADHSHPLTINGYPDRGSPILGTARGDLFGRADGDPHLALDGKPYTTLTYANGLSALAGKRQELWDLQQFHGQVCGSRAAKRSRGRKRPDLSDVDTSGPDYIQQALVPLCYETHSGEDVTIHARGPMAHLFRGVVEQHYVFHVMESALRLRERQ